LAEEDFEMKPEYYVFRTPPQREIHCTHLLRQYGLDVICLMRPEFKRAHRKHKVASVPKRVPMPALRPYIFIDMAPRMAWQRLHLCPVEVRPVGINGKPPKPLSASGIAYITDPGLGLWRDTEAPKSFSSDSTGPAYAIDDLVMIYGCGFDGLKGKVVDITGSEAKVLLPLFGSDREVSIPHSAAIKAA
jgi:transcription antitermination factor NusG